MSDEVKTQPQAGAEPEAVQAIVPEVEAEEFDKERALDTIKKLREFEKESKRLSKQVEQYEKAEKERKQAEMSEIDRLKAQYEEAAVQLQTLQTNELKRQAAAKHNLPDVLAARLQGSTLEEFEADAEELAKTLPKSSVKMGATNPGAAPAKQTDDELRAKLWNNRPTFDRAWAESHGGGVIEITKED